MDVREKLVELLQSAPADIMGNHGVGALADHLISHGVTVQEWISVDDRLPEDGGRVLAAHDDGVVRIGICRGYFPAVDAVPVVRCKDCRYFKTRLCENEDNHDDWFCADGERKENE